MARWLLAFAVVASLFLPTAAMAVSGDVHLLPMRPVRLKGKLRLQVDTRWVDGTGYRPILIEAIPTPGPAAEDRQIKVVLKTNGQSQREVSALIDIPQGSASVKSVIPVPQDELWYQLSVKAFENDQPISELESTVPLPRSMHWNWTETSPAVLWIDSDVPSRAARDSQINLFRSTGMDRTPSHNLPDYRNVVRVFPETNFANMMILPDGSQRSSDTDLLSQLPDVRAELLPLTELPERWLELTSFDMTFVSLADLQRLAAEQPQRFTALQDWLRTGPVLCVYGVGKDFEKLAELERQLKLPALPLPYESDERYRGWIVPDHKKQFSELPTGTVQVYSSPYGATVATPQMIDPAVDGSRGLPPPDTWPFLVREAGLGYVVAIADENPFPGKREYWLWMLNTIPENRWMWFRRHGMSQHRTNDDFWSFLIPGVGMAPVVSFLLLISLFAVFIGPVNYILLGRWRRLYLLLITVPVGAAAVTLGLFMYALITDGTGVRARVRSFTELDQRNGRAVSWSRQSYYAAIAPSRGLTFPEDAAVFPLLHEPTGRSGGRTSSQKLEWDEGQTLRSGYVSSRTAAQFLVIQAAPSASKLTLQAQAKDRPPRVKNELGVDIDYLLVADRQPRDPKAGQYVNLELTKDDSPAIWVSDLKLWEIRELKNGAVGNLQVADPTQAREELNRIYRDTATGYPKGYNPTMHNNALDFMMPDYRRWQSIDSSNGPPAMNTSVLESHLAILARRGELLLEPGMFLAVTESPPEVPLGVAGARQDASLHVVRGRW